VSGCWLVIALLLTGCFVALALGHPEDAPAETEWYFGAQALICSGRVLFEVHATVSSPPPRRRLLRLTGVVRGSMALGGLASLLYFPLRALYLEPAFASSKDFVPSLAIGVVEIVCAVLLPPRLCPRCMNLGFRAGCQRMARCCWRPSCWRPTLWLTPCGDPLAVRKVIIVDDEVVVLRNIS